jgi:S-phase kinase-associated protein 1
MSTVKLQAADNTDGFIEVEEKVARMSQTISNMLEDLGNSDLPVPLHNVSTKILTKVVEYCKYHTENPETQSADSQTTQTDKTALDISPWDKNFCEIDQETLFELILAANFLDIKPLLDLTCKTVANMIKGKSPEEIRKTFNIKNDFTPEEEEQIRKENEWCEER